MLALSRTAEAVSPTPTPTATPNPFYDCSGKLNTAVRGYIGEVLGYLTDCSLKDLAASGQCSSGQVSSTLIGFAGDISKALNDCSDDALYNLCPLEAKTNDFNKLRPLILTALTGDTNSFLSKLQDLDDDLFSTAFDGCARPASQVKANTPLYACANQIASFLGDPSGIASEYEGCYFNCERSHIKNPANSVCVDDVSGEPLSSSVSDCRTKELGFLSGIGPGATPECSDDQIVALGCPLGTHDVASLVTALGDRLTKLVQDLNLGIYHSACQRDLPGPTPSPLVPANVTLEPSLTHKQISCGQTIDGAFMGTDKTISFDSDLDCGPSRDATDGIIIAKSGVVLNGRLKTWSINGPSRGALRTGVGVRLMPGVVRVQIRSFKAIQNWGVGIQDADEANNKKVLIVKVTVRRNVQAGIRLRSPRARIESTTADKNGIGMDLSGDGTKVRTSDIKGSLYDPKVGLKLSGVDTNLNGSVVSVSGPHNTVELNQGVGILITEGPHVLSDVQVKDNVGAGIQIEALGVGSLLDNNGIKTNGVGVIVDGNNNLLQYNTAEENLGAGYVIGGTGNTVLNNNSGKKTDHGNGEEGYRITGQNEVIQDNAAEANVGSGFVIAPGATTTVFKGNTSESNFENGFDVQSAGNSFDSCSAEANDQAHPGEKAPRTFHEWVLVAGNGNNNKSNRAGGQAIGIPGAGGYCDGASDCPTN